MITILILLFLMILTHYEDHLTNKTIFLKSGPIRRVILLDGYKV